MSNYKFEEVKECFNNYELRKTLSWDYVAYDKRNQTITDDEKIVNKLMFSVSWFRVAQLSNSSNVVILDSVTEKDYENAFGSDAEGIYNSIMDIASNQVKETGNIDTIRIVESMSSEESKRYATNLFTNGTYLRALNKWVREITPDAKEQTEKLNTYDVAKMIEDSIVSYNIVNRIK